VKGYSVLIEYLYSIRTNPTLVMGKVKAKLLISILKSQF
jgi:hypothetical protein